MNELQWTINDVVGDCRSSIEAIWHEVRELSAKLNLNIRVVGNHPILGSSCIEFTRAKVPEPRQSKSEGTDKTSTRGTVKVNLWSSTDPEEILVEREVVMGELLGLEYPIKWNNLGDDKTSQETIDDLKKLMQKIEDHDTRSSRRK